MKSSALVEMDIRLLWKAEMVKIPSSTPLSATAAGVRHATNTSSPFHALFPVKCMSVMESGRVLARDAVIPSESALMSK